MRSLFTVSPERIPLIWLQIDAVIMSADPLCPQLLALLVGVGAYFGPGRADKTIPYDTYNKALELAKYPNTYVKVPGLGEFCARPMPFQQPYPFEEVPPLIEMALDAFGANRLMWGSDFPPSAAREGYRNTLAFPRERLNSRSAEDREWMFGETAATLWRFGE